jgi:hypothetical protein
VLIPFGSLGVSVVLILFINGKIGDPREAGSRMALIPDTAIFALKAMIVQETFRPGRPTKRSDREKPLRGEGGFKRAGEK